jgi:hypothetical protein
VLQCALTTRIESGRARDAGETAGGGACCGAGEGAEVEDGADRRAPLVSDLKEKEKGKVEVGHAGLVGRKKRGREGDGPRGFGPKGRG